MVSSGGRGRGRPPSLTPEQKREKDRVRQARHRRAAADEEFARLTNSARIIELEVLHWLDLLDFLVTIELLDPRDVENPPAIDDAVANLLNQFLDEVRAWRKADAVDDTRKLRIQLEDILFTLYSAIEDWRRPDAYGIPWGNIGYGRGLEAFKTTRRRTPAFGFEIDDALQADLRGGGWGSEQPREMQLSESEPAWTDAEVEALKKAAIRISETTLRLSRKEAREARDREDARARAEIRKRAARRRPRKG